MRRIEDIARGLFPKTATLKDGTPVTLRPMEKEDAGSLFEFFKRVPPEDRVFFKEDVTRRDVIDAWARTLDPERIFPLLAEAQGRIVADATLHRRTFGWMSHVGRLRVATAEDFRHRGLGSKLVEALIQVAREADLEQLDVGLMADQVVAIRAFQKLGFERTARFPEHVKDIVGRRHDLVVLVYDLKTDDDLY
jgi:L-amino acid N-acyltransferase YncA